MRLSGKPAGKRIIKGFDVFDPVPTLPGLGRLVPNSRQSEPLDADTTTTDQRVHPPFQARDTLNRRGDSQ